MTLCKMGESEALVFKFNFKNIPKDAIIQNIDIDRMRSTHDYGMIWLQAPTVLEYLMNRSKYGRPPIRLQKGFMKGHDYRSWQWRTRNDVPVKVVLKKLDLMAQI